MENKTLNELLVQVTKEFQLEDSKTPYKHWKGNINLLLGMIVLWLNFAITLFGLAGNIISLIIWSKPHLKKSSSVVLVALAVCDTIVILSGICFEIPVVYTSLKLYNGDRAYDAIYVNFIYNYYMRWSFYASRIIQRMVVIASVYLTMLITVERYICICHPFRFKQWCSYSRTCKLVAIIVIFSILYYMSLFWEFRLVGRTKMVNGQNVTLYKAEATELRRNPTYIKLKYVLMFIVVDYLLPLTCIITLNTFTYIKLRTINTERSSMTISQKNENKLTTMMLYVVVEFVVLTSLSGFISMARIFPIIITGYDVSHAFLILELQGLLNSLNSSVNFVTYVSSWEPFRKTFTEMMCCGEQRERLSANPGNCNQTPSTSATSF